MRPQFTRNNHAYSRFRKPKAASNGSLWFPSADNAPYLNYPITGQLASAVLLPSVGQTHARGVKMVLGSAYILQVTQLVIPLIAVYVVYLWLTIQGRADECDHNELVNGKGLNPVFAELYLSVGSIGATRSWFKISFTLALSDDVAPNAPQRTSAIPSFVSRDRPPFFRCEFFGGKFWISQGVNLLRQGLALVRPARLYQQSFGPFRILA